MFSFGQSGMGRFSPRHPRRRAPEVLNAALPLCAAAAAAGAQSADLMATPARLDALAQRQAARQANPPVQAMRPPVREAAPSPYPIRTNVFEPETNEPLIREVIRHESGRAAPGAKPDALTPRSAPSIRMTVLEPTSVEAPVREIITPEAQGLSQPAEQSAAQTPSPHAIQQNVFERDPDESPVREVIRLSPRRAAPRPSRSMNRSGRAASLPQQHRTLPLPPLSQQQFPLCGNPSPRLLWRTFRARRSSLPSSR